jgi:cob(I)alamin adenosyltransferase
MGHRPDEDQGTDRTGARVTTRTGDGGETSLFGPGRVRKTDPRIAALGDLDEAQAALGVARAGLGGTASATLLELQRGLYVAMSEVATPADRTMRLTQHIDAEAVAAIDALSTELRAAAPVEGRFVIPGGTAAGAALDLARTIVRRAERQVVAVADGGGVDGTYLLPWLNRVSDVVFLLARAAEAPAGGRTA